MLILLSHRKFKKKRFWTGSCKETKSVLKPIRLLSGVKLMLRLNDQKVFQLAEMPGRPIFAVVFILF